MDSISIIRKGKFGTFYSALKRASGKKTSSNFILNDLIEVFVYFKFLFDQVDEICVFTKSLDYLPSIYDNAIAKYKDVTSDQYKVLQNCGHSLENFIENENNSIKVIFMNDMNKGIAKSDYLEKIINIVLSKNTMQFRQLSPELSFVEGMDFFILVPQYNMVYTAQEIDDKKWNVCYFRNNALYENAKEIFRCFSKLSEAKKVEEICRWI